MTARLLALALLPVAVHAALLHGMVVEAQTGKALARALVVVQPVAGTAGATQSVRTNIAGVFAFPEMPAGAYLVIATRHGFAITQYASGKPVTLDEGADSNIRIRLPHLGAITGRIVDENDVGIPEYDVIVYRNTRPPQPVTHALTDDRGIYRVFNLEPGQYLVRTATKQYQDGAGYLPTFFKNVNPVESALASPVKIDQDTVDVTIRPAPGRLFTVSGRCNTPLSSRPQIEVSLISDMGIQAVTADERGYYKFQPAAPGKYELRAEVNLPRGGMLAAYKAIEIDRDTGVDLQLNPLPALEFRFEDTTGRPVDPNSVQLIARRKQLSGDFPPEFPRAGNTITVAPARWEFSLAPNYAYYVANFDGWNDVTVRSDVPVISMKFVLSMTPASITGIVTGDQHEPVPGAPVILQRSSNGEIRKTRTDIHGAYQFTGLAPGPYRILSTFEDPAMTAAQPLILEEGKAHPQNLTLYSR